MRHQLDPDEWTDERGEIFVRYQKLGICDEDERHRLQYAIIGCSSLRYMTREEHCKLIHTLEQLSEKPHDDQRRILEGLLALSGFDYCEAD